VARALLFGGDITSHSKESLMLLPLCAAVVVAASPEVESSAPPASPPPARLALGVSLSSTPLSASPFGVVGLGGLGMDSAAPRGGLVAEFRLATHWSLELGMEASFGSSGLGWQQLQLTANPGVRWYPRSTFDGPFLSLLVPVSWARSSFEFAAGDGTSTTSSATSWSAGGALLVGWCFAWDNGLLVTAAAGPLLTARRSDWNDAGTASSGAISLRTSVSIGVRL
jgi:hypothetical protein